MNSITFKCEFVTPAFIYGNSLSENIKRLELRASSIKGLMRFWWRAIYNDYKDPLEMRNREAEIFGGIVNIDGKESFEKAKGSIRVKIEEESIKKNSDAKKGKDSGLDYLFYSMILFNPNKNNKHFEKNTEFQVTFNFKNASKTEVIEYLKAFNALQLLGGIGSRSNRGAGNFVIRDMKLSGFEQKLHTEFLKYIFIEGSKKNIFDYYNQFSNFNEVKDIQHSNIISKKAKIYMFGLESNKQKIDEFDIWSELRKLKRFDDNMEESMDCVGRIYEATRKNTHEDKTNIKRGESPLIIKIIRDMESYKVLLIKMDSKFNDPNNPENKIVDEFFGNIIKFSKNKLKDSETLKEIKKQYKGKMNLTIIKGD